MTAASPLLRTPSPYEDESLMGYLLRLAEANAAPSLKAIFELAGLPMHAISVGWRALCGPRVDLSRLAHVACLDDEHRRRLDEARALAGRAGLEHYIPGWNVPARAVRFTHPKVCPTCLGERAYCRRSWDVLAVTACLRHGRMLLDTCPHCRQRIGWTRAAICSCRCGCDWRETPSPPLEVPRRRATSLLARAAGLIDESEPASDEHRDRLRPLGLGDLCVTLLAIARTFRLGHAQQPIHSTMDNATCHEAMEEAANVFALWPDGFRHVCDRTLGERHGPEFVADLNALAERQPTAFLRLALDEYLTERHRARTIHDLPPLDRSYVPPEEARRRLGVGQAGFERFVTRRDVCVIPGALDPTAIFIDVEALRRIAYERERLLSVADAAANLGLAARHIAELVRHAILEAASGPDIDGFDELRFTAAAIVDLYTALDDRSRSAHAPFVSVHVSRDLIDLRRALEVLNKADVDAGEWLRAVLDGHATPLKLLPASAASQTTYSLQWFAFETTEVERYVESRCSKIGAGIVPSPGADPTHSPAQDPRRPVLPITLATAFLRTRRRSTSRTHTRPDERSRSISDLVGAAQRALLPRRILETCQLMRET